MRFLNEKLLLEEDGFEDVEDTETETPQETTEDAPESTLDDASSEDTNAQENDTTSEPSGNDEVENDTTTLYKVSFSLGKHENWSRVEAPSKEEAEQIVRDYITKKWPDREFEVIETTEFNEEEMEESLNESLKENVKGQGKYSDKFYAYLDKLQDGYHHDSIVYLATQLIRYCKEDDLKDLWEDKFSQQDTDDDNSDELDESLSVEAQPIETGADVGMASIISDLIKDEYEAIDGYNSAIATAEAEGYGDMVTILTEIQAEENLHIGQLQTLMTTVDPNAHLVDDGKQEGEEQLANPIMTNESLKENVEIGRPDYSVDMSDEEYEEFRELLTKHYGSPADFFKRLHSFKPDFEIHNVDYDDITEECVVLSSADISQGTGNVIVYTVMGKDTGKIYRYADF